MTFDVHALDEFVLVGSTVTLLAILAVRISSRAGLPSLLIYLLMGVLLVGATVTIASQVDRLWVALNDHLSGIGGGLSARLGLAYPLARKLRPEHARAGGELTPDELRPPQPRGPERRQAAVCGSGDGVLGDPGAGGEEP